MPTRGTLKALELVDRIKQREIEDVASQLSAIRTRQREVQSEIENLHHIRDREGRADEPEAVPFLAGFLRAIRKRTLFLEEELAALDLRAAEFETSLQSAFVGKKSNEAAIKRTITHLNTEKNRMEDIEFEEIARNAFLLRRKARG